jgi:ribosome-interacting GTPase 1
MTVSEKISKLEKDFEQIKQHQVEETHLKNILAKIEKLKENENLSLSKVQL